MVHLGRSQAGAGELGRLAVFCGRNRLDGTRGAGFRQTFDQALAVAPTMNIMRVVLAWGYLFWIAAWTLPFGLWGLATGNYVVGGIFLGLTTYGLAYRLWKLIAPRRFAKPSGSP